ncbi:nicotinamide riboside transporter PnuC [Flavobacteriaceae bacterium]|jgi:nicotinamide mononucleotide transporter|nr:nicotinamide riboside transporter PnuC [Flavobacteriaceae bacterium]
MFDLLFQQYSDYETLDISLEIIAVVFGILSVWFSKKNNILVYPTGMISTSIFTYLLFKWSLLGDMMINAYYFVMSVYGWYIWTRKVNNIVTPISKVSSPEKITSLIIFFFSLSFVYGIYNYFDKWGSYTSYIDNFTTAIFFVAMWLMANRKIENWIFWIIGNIISIPLYFYKGLTFTSIQYIIFTVIAISGYYTWKKILDNSNQTA